MKFTFFLFFLILPLLSKSQIYTYTDNSDGIYNTIDTLVSADTLTRVNGAKKPPVPCGNGFVSHNFKIDSFSIASPAIELTLAPIPQAVTTFDSLAIDLRRTVTGTVLVRFGYSLDTGKTWINQTDDIIPRNGVCDETAMVSWNFENFTTTGQVIFRIYGYKAKALSGTLQLKNINVHGIAKWIDQDGDGYSKPEDCNDSDTTIHPNSSEICNAIDDDCNGVTDDSLIFVVYYADSDSDGYGNYLSVGDTLCSAPGAGYVINNIDCNDSSAVINPITIELCNGVDDNCDGQIDEGTLLTFYADGDGDGFGNPNFSIQTCVIIPGYLTDSSDCDDNVNSINPAATEICNDIDDDCNGVRDDSLLFFKYYADANGDGFGEDSLQFISSCLVKPDSGYVAVLEPQVEITITSTEKILNPWLHGLSFGDIYSDSKNKDRDTKGEPIFSNLLGLNLQNIQGPGEGTTSHHDKRIKGDTIGTVADGAIGMAYNMGYCTPTKPCAQNPPVYDEKCSLKGIGCTPHPWSYFPYSIETMVLLGINKLDFYYNVRLNDYDATIDNLTWAKSKGVTDIRIELGDEYDLSGYDNATLLPNGVADYKLRVADAKAKFEGLGYKVFADGAEISRTSSLQVKWNSGLVGWPVYGINQYFKDNWIIPSMPVGTTPEAQLDSVKKAVNVTFPLQMDMFRNKFPGVKCAITSWGQTAAGSEMGSFPYVNTPVAGFYVFWHYKSMVEYNLIHDDIIATASYYRGANLGLVDVAPKWAYNALYCIGKLQSDSAIIYEMTTNISGLTGIATYNGQTHTIAFTNETGNSIPLNYIKADGKIKSIWTGESISSQALSQNAYLINPMAKTIPPYSMVYVKIETYAP